MHSSRKQVNPFTPRFHYCPLHNYYDSSLENLVLDQLLISQLTFLFILITCLLDIVLILSEEILSRSLVGVKRLLLFTYHTSVGGISGYSSHEQFHKWKHCAQKSYLSEPWDVSLLLGFCTVAGSVGRFANYGRENSHKITASEKINSNSMDSLPLLTDSPLILVTLSLML